MFLSVQWVLGLLFRSRKCCFHFLLNQPRGAHEYAFFQRSTSVSHGGDHHSMRSKINDDKEGTLLTKEELVVLLPAMLSLLLCNNMNAANDPILTDLRPTRPYSRAKTGLLHAFNNATTIFFDK